MMALVYWWGWELAHPVLLATEAGILALAALGAFTAWLMDRPEPAQNALWQAHATAIPVVIGREPTRKATAAERDWWLTPDDVARRHARDCDNLRHAAHLALDNLTATIDAGEA